MDIIKIPPNKEQVIDKYLDPNLRGIEAAIEAYKNGSFLVVSDDENGENEGDLIIAAEFANKEAINFMITHGKGLVCMTITEDMALEHGLCPK